MNARRLSLAAALVAMMLVESPVAGEQIDLILDMDTVRHRMGQITDKDKQKMPAGTVELAEGKVGKACKFTFVEGASSGFATAWVPAKANWDQAAGFSFWVKGDGSSSWGGIELIDGEDYGLRYAYCFPIDSTDWTKISVPWRDVIPELKGPLVDAKNGYAPRSSRISGSGNGSTGEITRPVHTPSTRSRWRIRSRPTRPTTHPKSRGPGDSWRS